MTSRVTYNDKLRTNAVHLRSGSTIETDAPLDNEGKGERFSPTDLVATALASCMLTIMGIAARTNDINIKGTEASSEKVMASDPRRISEINVTIKMPKGKNYTEREQKILERAALHCPVHKSLHPDLKSQVDFIW